MQFQKALELSTKARLCVVLFLGIDVADCILNLRNPDRKRPIRILPRKRAPFRMIVHPLGRAALDQLKGFGYRQGCRQRQQGVDMIGHSTHGERFEFIGSGDSTDVCPNLCLRGFGNQGLAVLGGEKHNALEDSHIYVTWWEIVRYFHPSPAGTSFVVTANPPLKRRAIFICALRALARTRTTYPQQAIRILKSLTLFPVGPV
jgi:hypothetical protein